jgi:DNA polymerase-3 subunit delta
LATVAASDLKPVYLLSGADRPKVARAVERLRGHFGEAAVESLSADETSGEGAVAACNALGLFGGDGRLVLVRRVEQWKAGDAGAVAAYLKSPAPATVLALVAESLKKDSPLARECAKAGDVLVYEAPRRDLPRWARDQLARAGATADLETCRALVELAGDDLVELASEVDKLAAWAGGAEIRIEDVERLVGARAEAPPWALTDAWGRRDIGAVLAECESALERTSASALVWRMAEHVALVRACRSFVAQGVSPADAAKRLRKKEFPVRKAYAQAEGYDGEELASAVVRLAELDVAVKGGSRLPDELELERALVDVTRGRRPERRGD